VDGNCQVSSTLYNAVLAVSDFEIVERHPHIKEVHYVEKDKDATVSYGSVDFKFKNNSSNDIKIYANSDLNSVNIRIVKIEEH
jgi:vancomycin resistance protein YoaR